MMFPWGGGRRLDGDLEVYMQPCVAACVGFRLTGVPLFSLSQDGEAGVG